MVTDFARGLRDVAGGARFLASRPALWKWIAAPVAVTALLLVLVVWAAFAWLEPMVADLLGFLPGWLSALVGAVKVLLFLLLLVGGYFLFATLSMLLTAPFCELLSEAVEEELTGAGGPPLSMATFARDLVLGVVHAARRLFAYLVTVGVLLLLGLVVPVVGPPLAIMLGAVATAKATAYDAYDAVWARKGWGYREKMAYLGAHRGRAYGLGAVVAGLLAVPVVNLMALPLGAAGATLAYVEGAAGDA